MKLLLQSIEGEHDSNIICSITDIEGTILYANPKFCEISGYSSQELEGAKHNIINAKFHPPCFFEDMWKTIAKGKIWQGEVKNKAKDGSYYWVDTIIFPIAYSKDSKAHYLSVRTLINDKKHAEFRKEERLEELKRLINTISHQMRQPITQVLGLLSVLELTAEVPESLKTTLELMQTSANKLNEYTIALTQQVEHIAKQDKII